MKSIKDVLKRVLSTRTKPKEVVTVPIEEYNKIKQALKQTNAKVKSLCEDIKLVTEEKENLTKDYDTLKANHRKDIIQSIHEFCNFTSDEIKNRSIESLTKSNLTIDQIKDYLVPLFFKKGSGARQQQGTTTTKFPQRSQENNRVDSSFIK